MKEALNAALLAARRYQSGLDKPASPSPAPDKAKEASVRIELDGQLLGRLIAPAVSAEIGFQARRKQVRK